MTTTRIWSKLLENGLINKKNDLFLAAHTTGDSSV